MTGDLSTNDIQLTATDIGVLENADQIARLGDNVDNSIPLGHSVLGLDTVDLGCQVQHIRSVGEDPDDGEMIKSAINDT